jgi:hypothetical protein
MVLGFLSKSYLPPVKHIPSEATGFVARTGNTIGQFVLLQELSLCSLDMAVPGSAAQAQQPLALVRKATARADH